MSLDAFIKEAGGPLYEFNTYGFEDLFRDLLKTDYDAMMDVVRRQGSGSGMMSPYVGATGSGLPQGGLTDEARFEEFIQEAQGEGPFGGTRPSVIEQVFGDAAYREGGVIPEQPFETQAPVVEPQQEAGGGGATPTPAPTPSTPTTMPDQQVDPEQPYRYEGNGRFVNVLTGDVINRNVPDTFVVGDFYGLPQNVEANIPDSGAAEEVVDVFTPVVLPGTLDPDLFDVEPDVELPAQTPSEAAQEPLPQQDVGEDTTAAEGGQGAGEGAGEGSGEGDGSGEGAGTGMMSTAATQFEPEWTKLFKYTKLTPYQKKALRPFMGTLTQARGMLS